MAISRETDPEIFISQLEKVDFAAPAIVTFREYGKPNPITVVHNSDEVELVTLAKGEAGRDSYLGLTANDFIGLEVVMRFYSRKPEEPISIDDPVLAEAKIGWAFFGSADLGMANTELKFSTSSRIHEEFDPASTRGRWLLGALSSFGQTSALFKVSAGESITGSRFRNPIQDKLDLFASRFGIQF